METSFSPYLNQHLQSHPLQLMYYTPAQKVNVIIWTEKIKISITAKLVDQWEVCQVERW